MLSKVVPSPLRMFYKWSPASCPLQNKKMNNSKMECPKMKTIAKIWPDVAMKCVLDPQKHNPKNDCTPPIKSLGFKEVRGKSCICTKPLKSGVRNWQSCLWEPPPLPSESLTDFQIPLFDSKRKYDLHFSFEYRRKSNCRNSFWIGQNTIHRQFSPAQLLSVLSLPPIPFLSIVYLGALIKHLHFKKILLVLSRRLLCGVPGVFLQWNIRNSLTLNFRRSGTQERSKHKYINNETE